MFSRSRVKIQPWFFISASPLESVSLSLFLCVPVSFSSLYLSLSNTHTHTQKYFSLQLFLKLI